MIIVAIVRAVLAVLKLLLSPIHLPSLDGTVLQDVTTLFGYITADAYNMVYLLLPKGTVSTLFVILLLVIAARHLYSFVMWIIRKLPVSTS